MAKEKTNNILNIIKGKKLYIISTLIAAVYTAIFFGTYVIIFYKLRNTFTALPYIMAAFAMAPIIFAILNIFIFKNKAVNIAVITVSALMALGHFLFTAYVLEKLIFIVVSALPILAIIAILALFLFLILGYPKLGKRAKMISVIVISVIIFFVCVFGILNLNFFYYTSGGVVFAVEDEYQIAWSTSVNSIGYVTVGESIYYDIDNGENCVCTLHKVSIPMNVLDEAKGYTITSVPVYAEAAYLSVSGKEHSVEYTFRPVDTSDGLQIYNISDNHEVLSGASKAAKYFGSDLDILILNGDIINDVSTLYQITLIYKLANRITGGEVPVIYSRGNHECNGKYAERLADYVGSYNGKLYYNVKLGDAYFTVLDTNNDMQDTDYRIAPSANHATQRAEETEWLNSLTYWGEDCTYRILIAHMGFALSDYSRFPEWTAELIEATDGKYDLCLSGHTHVTDYSPAGTATKTSYPVIRGSIRSNTRASGEGVDPAAFTGTALTCVNGSITAMFTNSKGEVRSTIAVK
ncbi:MAG: metallophosphoesterase [Clostridia bacterium]|nr:metallophosphoesterase [Clostridia bacterium]